MNTVCVNIQKMPDGKIYGSCDDVGGLIIVTADSIENLEAQFRKFFYSLYSLEESEIEFDYDL